MVKSKKLYCRFPGCTYKKGFTSRAGRLYHEKTKHGRGFLSVDKGDIKPNNDDDTTATKPQNTQDTQSAFIEIREVKLMAVKETKKDDMDECGGCGEKIPVDSKFCPKCGAEFK